MNTLIDFRTLLEKKARIVTAFSFILFVAAHFAGYRVPHELPQVLSTIAFLLSAVLLGLLPTPELIELALFDVNIDEDKSALFGKALYWVMIALVYTVNVLVVSIVLSGVF